MSDNFALRLYVAGQTPKAVRAFSNLRKICEEHLQGRYSIEVIDLIENPALGRGDQILALPTLVRRLPTPIKKIIGDLSNTCLLYTSPSPRDGLLSRMPSSA